jgi:hypothetical protein
MGIERTETKIPVKSQTAPVLAVVTRNPIPGVPVVIPVTTTATIC